MKNIVDRINYKISQKTKNELIPILSIPFLIALLFFAINTYPIYENINKVESTMDNIRNNIDNNLKTNENYIYLGDMFQVSEIRLRQVIDGGRFIFMEHTRLSEKEVNRFKRKGFFIGSIESVKKLMEENNVNNEEIELINIFEDIEIKMAKKRI